MSHQWVAHGEVHAPVPAVFTALLAVGPTAGARPNPDTFTDTDGVQRFQASIGEPASTVTIEVDQPRHVLAVQGNWWYRGVYTVQPCPAGSRLEYRVYNIATRLRWAVPLMQRHLPQQMRHDLTALLQTIGRHLSRPANLDPEGDRPG